MNSRFMSGVGIVALAGALVAAPAYASDGESEGASNEEASAEEYRLPAGPAARTISLRSSSPTIAGTFAGLDQTAAPISYDGGIDAAIRQYVGGGSKSGGNIIPRIITRADIVTDGPDVVDVNETLPSVVQIFSADLASGDVSFNCTGSVINPRTILTAAHCLNFQGSETYGLPGSGATTTMLISTGFDSSVRLFNTLDFGVGYAEGGAALSTDVVIHASGNLENGQLPFPFADIALIAVDSPITDVPILPLVLTPLTELTHVIHVGYGTSGDGLGGQRDGSPFLRRVGENMLGALASFADFDDVVFSAFAPNALDPDFPSITSSYYWTDFDWPDRDIVNPAVGRPWGCEFNGFGPECQFIGDVLAIDWFDGDALPNESATAPGDSGSPLIADQIYSEPVAIGVLSGGLNFFRGALNNVFGTDNVYGDISFYTPLYPFFQFISENTAYKYVSAAAGDGVWSDPTRWTQDLDPGFLIHDGNGNLVNGLPEGEETGIFDTGPNIGTILGVDIAEFPEIVSPVGPQPGDPNFGANTPESSVLLGPGSTGFVPQNTDGIVGTAFANPAQYFEVHLNRAGATTVDIDVEIDKLVIDNFDAGFILPEEQSFSSLIEVFHLNGFSVIDGTLSTPLYILGQGLVEGTGTIETNAFFNVAGSVATAGLFGGIGTLSIDGDFVQTELGAALADFTVDRRRNVTSDLLDVSGIAVLDGLLVVSTTDSRPRFGTEFTVLSAAEGIDGNFSDVLFFTRSPTLAAEARVEGNEVVVEIVARSIRDIVGSRSSFKSLGGALDKIRDTKFNQFTSLFDLVDGSNLDTFGATLFSLTPSSAFQQTFTANSFSQRFTGQIAQRTLSLRGGSRAAGGFTAAGTASYAINGTSPAETGKVGFFGSASGVFVNGGQPVASLGYADAFATGLSIGVVNGAGGANALEQASLTQAGELTVGADMQVAEGFSFGVAMSRIRSSELTTGALQPQEDTSESMAVFMTYSDGGLFADGYAGTAEQQFGVARAASGELAGLYRNAVGQSDGTQTFGGLRLGYAMELAKGLEVGPVVSLDYVRSQIDGYTEFGMDSLGLAVAERSFTSLGAKAGAMASFDLMAGKRTAIRAFGSVAYASELADTADVVQAHFVGASEAPFTIANQIDPNWVSVNAGAEVQVGRNLTASVSVTSDMGRGILSNDQAQVSLGWRF